DKREILCSLLERNTEEVRLFVGSLDPEKGNPVDVLEDVLTKILRNLYEKRKLIAATMQAYYEDVDLRGNLEPPSNMQEKHPLWEIRVFIRKIIARGVEKKFFRPVDPVMAETALNALIMGVAKQFAMDMLGFSGEVYMVTVRKLAVQGLCERNTSSQ
ncbi:MAG TPA: hypothetical protein PK364_12405, partial [Synergistaceae bacterium]|nr:hypothetical protein [Synergistaceae bacterium]